MSALPDDRDPIEGLSIKKTKLCFSNVRLGDDERDRKRKIFSSRPSASKEKSSTMLLSHEGTEASLNTAQDFKVLLRQKKKNGFKLIKSSKSKVPSEQKERRSSKKSNDDNEEMKRNDSFRFERRKTQIEIQSR